MIRLTSESVRWGKPKRGVPNSQKRVGAGRKHASLVSVWVEEGMWRALSVGKEEVRVTCLHPQNNRRPSAEGPSSSSVRAQSASQSQGSDTWRRTSCASRIFLLLSSLSPWWTRIAASLRPYCSPLAVCSVQIQFGCVRGEGRSKAGDLAVRQEVRRGPDPFRSRASYGGQPRRWRLGTWVGRMHPSPSDQ